MDRPTKKFVVTYTDTCDRNRREIWRCFAFDAQHAEEKFYDTFPCEEEGWEFLSVDRPRDVHGRVDTQYDRP